MNTPTDAPRLTFLGKFVMLLFIAGALGAAYYLWPKAKPASPSADPNGTGAAQPSPTQSPREATANAVTIGVAYGTEKKRWFTWAVEQFAQTPAGKNVTVNLVPLGSVEASRAILKKDKTINVWSPASSLPKGEFVSEWQMQFAGQNPILKSESLALTPMVFVMWAERYEAFMGKYKEVSFKTIAQALAEPGGWNSIASKPQWGLFKFGHTNPASSNSGLVTLVLMAYDHSGKSRDLTMADITSVPFVEWARKLQRNVTGLSHSTGTMMQEMIQRGPSTYDCLFVYENTAIDYIANAEGRWGSLKVVYPERNIWNESPYYILDVAWSSKEQRKASQAFLDFLLSEPSQQQALTHGFRPANVSVAIKTPESPFTRLEGSGLRVDLADVAEPPAPDVLANLLLSWQRARSGN